MTSQASPEALVGRIYDAALDATLWPDLLCEIADACGVRNAALVIVDRAAGYSSVVSPRTDPGLVEAYGAYWWRHDPTAAATAHTPVGRLTTLADTGRDLFMASAFHNEFWCHSGLGAERLAANLVVGDDTFSSIVFQPARRRDAVDAETHRRAGHIVPHLARAVTIGQRLQRLELERAATAHALGPEHAGLVLVDAGRRAVFADTRAEALFSAGTAIRVADGLVRLTDPKADVRLGAAIEACARNAGEPCGDRIRLDRGGPPLVAEVLPYRANAANPCGTPVVAILAFRRREPPAMAVQLRHRFGLTPAEAALAIEMAKGDGRQAAAYRCGISINTARTHLTRIFDKTGVRRQAELIRVLMEMDAGR